MFARWRWLVGVRMLVPALAPAEPSGAQACRNYLTADQLVPRFDQPLAIPTELPPYYRGPDGTPVRVLHAHLDSRARRVHPELGLRRHHAGADDPRQPPSALGDRGLQRSA